MATYEDKKAEFLKLFASDPDIKKLPLPDSIREKLGIYQDISYVPPAVAVNKCFFSGERYDSYEERPAVEGVVFPDLAKLAEEQKSEMKTNVIEHS